MARRVARREYLVAVAVVLGLPILCFGTWIVIAWLEAPSPDFETHPPLSAFSGRVAAVEYVPSGRLPHLLVRLDPVTVEYVPETEAYGQLRLLGRRAVRGRPLSGEQAFPFWFVWLYPPKDSAVGGESIVDERSTIRCYEDLQEDRRWGRWFIVGLLVVAMLVVLCYLFPRVAAFAVSQRPRWASRSTTVRISRWTRRS